MSNIPGLRTIETVRTCIACNDFPSELTFQKEEFSYGQYGTEQAILCCVVPVWTCKGKARGCGLAFTDWRSEQIRAKTVEQYLDKTSYWFETPELIAAK
jgi:hypothetical protein